MRKKWLISGAVVALVAIVVVIVIVASSGGGSHKSAAKKKSQPVHKRAAGKKIRTAPLTGVPDKSGDSFKRPAVTVKINNLEGKEQSGVDRADVVYEEVVEGGITRLAAVFNSQAPNRVGPVRSVRRTDPDIVWPIGGIFAYSGGATYAVDAINTAPVKQLDESRAGALMFRDPVGARYAPFNLWARVDQMYAVDATPVPPHPLFTYRKPGAKIAGTQVAAVTVGFTAGYAVTWEWDAKSGTWLRSRFGKPDAEADGVRLAPKNVVVLFVHYAGGAGVEGSEAQLTGTGDAWVFTDGKEIKGHWSRPTKDDVAKLTDAAGKQIGLTPGQTWVELPEVSYPVTTLP